MRPPPARASPPRGSSCGNRPRVSSVASRPQTPGELRARSGRLHSFADNADVVVALNNLIERDGEPLVSQAIVTEGSGAYTVGTRPSVVADDLPTTPLPASLVMMLTGLLGLGIARVRRARAGDAV